MLHIANLHVSIDSKPILKGINLEVGPGEVHAIMGPNGSGKSTLAAVLAGRDTFVVTKGKVTYKKHDLLKMDPEERAREGLFLAFQYPVELPGVGSMTFLKTAYNEIRKHKGEEPLDAIAFLDYVKKKKKIIDLHEDLTKRSVNVGFSGGEKKKHEVFQMAVLEPELVILDETDSGLDIDALKVVADGVNKMRSKDRSFLIITHYQRLLRYIEPDMVHVLMDGEIKKSGDKELALELEKTGYDSLKTA